MSLFRLPMPVWNATTILIYATMLLMLCAAIGFNFYKCRQRGRLPQRAGKRSKKAPEGNEKTGTQAASGGNLTASSASSAAQHPNLRIDKSVSGRRILVTSRTIEIGTCLASDSAILVAPSLPRAALQIAFDALSAEAQDQVWTFSDALAAATTSKDGSQAKTLYGILRTNVLPIGPPMTAAAIQAASVDETGATTTPLCRAENGGLFPLLSRAQHSCLPNTEAFFSHSRKRAVAYPLKRLEEGEEVTRSVLEGVERMDYEQRQRAMQKEFGLAKCVCSFCVAQSAPNENGATRSDARTTSDANRRRIGTLSTVLSTLHSDPARARQTAERLLDLLAAEGFGDSAAAMRVLEETARLIAGTPTYESQSAEYATRAWEQSVLQRGADSTRTSRAKLRMIQAQEDLQAAGVREKKA